MCSVIYMLLMVVKHAHMHMPYASLYALFLIDFVLVHVNGLNNKPFCLSEQILRENKCRVALAMFAGLE